ncbi:MAG: hypothetical protein ABJG47_17355 [Ekhidna sp.]
MKKKVLLFEDDLDLKENIAELIEINGYSVETFSSDSLVNTSVLEKDAIAIFNTSTVLRPVDEFIHLLGEKVDSLIVLCTDANNILTDQADAKIVLPFEEVELISTLRKLSSSNDFFRNNALNGLVGLALTVI